ncbi:MAG: carbohydrate binding family 9 domain-containing protein, partial [Gemmatimonadota bacterium]
MPMLLGLAALLSLPAPDSLTFSGRDGGLDVEVPRVESPAVDIDGNLDEPVWREAAVLDGFTQYEPVEGVIPEERTEVRVFYTPDAIYFGIHAYDPHPDLILARMGERDRAVFGDDWVRIMLDTFDDQRQAYVFYVNPLGLQTDGLWIEGFQRRGGRGGGGGGGGGGG